MGGGGDRERKVILKGLGVRWIDHHETLRKKMDYRIF